MAKQKQEFVEKGAATDRQRSVVAAGASLREPVDWHSINWNKAHRNVRRLQARIVKAMKYQSRVRQNGRLQRLERCALKVARTVLRGLGGSNAPWLPDEATGDAARFTHKVV
jgi:hypothetical protein